MVGRVAVIAALACAVAPVVAQQPANTDLEVTRVAVFSSGVAFFECDGTVIDDGQVELKFRTDQINDILKSLVVQDYDGGTISVVDYASQDPVAKTLKSFAVDITGKPTFGELLDQLRGEPVSIAGPRKVEGVIVGVEKIRKAVGDIVVETEMVNILASDGIQSFPVHELQGLNLTNAKMDSELRKALAALAAGRDADKKTVVVNFDGKGERRVRVRYLLEAPIWKTSYRLVLGDDAPFLQGWATVENTTEEDWENVRLSLVSGRPISFRMDLYTPIYIPRPLEQLELYASLRPPEYEGAVNAPGAPPASKAMLARRARGVTADFADMVAEAAEAESMGADAYAYGAGGFSAGLGVASVAEAGDAGELFQYVVGAPVTIGRQRSAMLPIVTQNVDAEKVSIYNPATHPKHPLNGLLFKNSTDLSLMQGPVTIFDGGTYAGDAKLPNLQPEEERLLAYALDLGMEVSQKNQYADNEVSFRIDKGVLFRQMRTLDEREYVSVNRDDKPRELIIEQDLPNGWKLLEPAKPYEETANMLRFRQTVASGASQSLKVKLERVYEQAAALLNINVDQIELYLRSRVISKDVKEALQKVVELRKDLSRITREREEAERQAKAAADDQARLRENLRTLNQNSDQYARQLKKFDEVETKIEQWKKQADDMRAAEEAKRRELEDYVLGLKIN